MMEKFEPFLLGTYGTLKRGHGNHGVIRHCEFIGECITDPEYTMLSINGWFPGVIEDGEDSIQLEVFKINDPKTACRLDILEGYPDLYEKSIVNTPYGEALIYTYNNPVEDMDVIKTGNWVL